MRIAFLTHYSGLYGANRSLLDLIDGLQSYGVESFVIAPREGDIERELLTRGVAFRACNLGRWVSAIPDQNDALGFATRIRLAVGNARKNFRALPTVVDQLRSWKPDIVYSNSSLLLSGFLAARYLGLPHVWHLREFGDLDYGYQSDLGPTVQKWLINRTDAVIAISKSIRDHFQAGPRSRIRVVYGGVAWESGFDRQRELAQRFEPRSDVYTFALVGLLHSAKGQETAIRALHRVVQQTGNVRLVLAGSGRAPCRRHLEQLVETLHLRDHVEFLGYIDDPFEVYQDADAVLMCSQNEAMGRVTIEAMAACRPVIGYRGGGTREIIEHEETGLLYEGGSEALAACMLELMERPAWGRELGKNAWHRARDRFTIERYAASVYDVLREVGQERQSSVREAHIVATDWT